MPAQTRRDAEQISSDLETAMRPLRALVGRLPGRGGQGTAPGSAL
ncbi:hypothetical protein [Streptomyces sp. SID2888]|nr:hypothetical protein [Streptomyces sp. SID2888]